MAMTPLVVLLVAVAMLGVSAVVAGLLGFSPSWRVGVGTVGNGLASILGGLVGFGAMNGGAEESLRLAWSLPVGQFHLGLDPLSGFFLFCLFTVGGITALYGAGYLSSHGSGRASGPTVALYNLLVASMALLLVARDGILFLMAWEAMSLTSLLLVTREHQDPSVQRAGFVYLVASHLGVVLLFILFALLARRTANYDFDAWMSHPIPAGRLANVCLLLGLLGFGTKAGIWPLHGWLPYAHPAAPSPVSALMSGIMIKMGIYGILRTQQFVGTPVAWWGPLLVVLGVASAIMGVLLALAQHDLKRLLAYHSVENIGIIVLGLGLGVLGQSHHQPAVALLGYAGALFHVFNHAVFKSLLFQAAGSVLNATGQGRLSALGGLLGPMPLTGCAFLLGSVAICGLPPLNGFVSEWLLYLAALRAGGSLDGPMAMAAVAVLVFLALAGGLALLCFAKAFGTVFLGVPRSRQATEATEANGLMGASMLLLCGLCIVGGCWPSLVLVPLLPVIGELNGAGTPAVEPLTLLAPLARTTALLAGVVLVLVVLRWMLLRRRSVPLQPTWRCGYSAVTPRMQYSAESFAAPVLSVFGGVLGRREEQQGPNGYFPERASYSEHAADLVGDRWLFSGIAALLRATARIRVLQHGRVQLYLVYILVTLVALLVWQVLRKGT